jgi:hypothetical protein
MLESWKAFDFGARGYGWALKMEGLRVRGRAATRHPYRQ